ncbi:MAG: tRNA pseudouridine(55) synthase TruB [Patescibacteria group bacterium]|nr:tRNA pseudouridine(55) synthase TruB [Patescibacteria group bacterium]
MKKETKSMEGIFAIDKPLGMTSHDVVAKMRKISGIQKVGHAGTLDPLATGVLVVGVGSEATRKLGRIVEKEKEYIAEIKLGVESTTDDEEGEKTVNEIKHVPKLKNIEKVLTKFVGEIIQLSPRFSAVRIRGKRAHKRARDGEEFSLPPRSVEIKEIKILEYVWPCLRIEVKTGIGVYIRSLARDIGKELGVGGYLTGLQRTRVGQYSIEKAQKLANLEVK